MTARTDTQIGNLTALGGFDHSRFGTAREQVIVNAVGIGKVALAKVTDADMVIAMAVDNTAAVAGANLKNINIAGVQFGQGKGSDFVDGVVAIVMHHIV